MHIVKDDPGVDPPGDSDADHEAGIEALRRVLESSSFRRAEQSRDFLAYVVHETLVGRGHLLNERQIARLALGRPRDFDARNDPSVRVLAGRVRQRLERYYRNEGSNDPLRIGIPLGQYAAVLTPHSPTGPAVVTRRADAGPSIAVVRFRSGGRGATDHQIAAGLSESLVHALTRFPGVQVAGPLAPSGTSGPADVIDVGLRSGAEFVLHGRVREVDGLVRVNVHLADARTGQVLWSETLDEDVAAFTGFGAEDELVARVAAQIADVRGVILRNPIQPTQVTERHGAYEAIARYYTFLDTLDPMLGFEVLGDLESAAIDEPHNPMVLGVLAEMHAIAVLMLGAAGAPESVERAEHLAHATLHLDPRSPFAHAALGTTKLARGDVEASRRHVEALVASAPHHPSFLYHAGLLTAGGGDWDGGIALVRRSIRLNPHHPGHHHTLLAIDHIKRGDIPAALAEATLLGFPAYIWGPLCTAVCFKELGLDDEASREITHLLEVAPDFFERPREWIGNAPAISDEIVELLVQHVDGLRTLVR